MPDVRQVAHSVEPTLCRNATPRASGDRTVVASVEQARKREMLPGSESWLLTRSMHPLVIRLRGGEGVEFARGPGRKPRGICVALVNPGHQYCRVGSDWHPNLERAEGCEAWPLERRRAIDVKRPQDDGLVRKH